MMEKAHRLRKLLKLNSEQANKCFAKQLSLITGKFKVDIIALDDILHERHGDYEKEKKSMAMIITEHYGEVASQFIRQAI